MPKLGKIDEPQGESEFDAHGMYMKRVQAMRDRDKGVGWYQDDNGGLYHFNGSVWDVLPDEVTKGLEYLG